MRCEGYDELLAARRFYIELLDQSWILYRHNPMKTALVETIVKYHPRNVQSVVRWRFYILLIINNFFIYKSVHFREFWCKVDQTLAQCEKYIFLMKTGVTDTNKVICWCPPVKFNRIVVEVLEECRFKVRSR